MLQYLLPYLGLIHSSYDKLLLQAGSVYFFFKLFLFRIDDTEVFRVKISITMEIDNK